MVLEPEFRIATPESVRLNFDLAGLGSRSLAYMVDILIKAGILIALSLFLHLAGGFARFRQWGGIPQAVMAVSVFLLQWFYFVLFEAFAHGQTPGKKALGIRVVKDGGHPIGFLESLIRNLLRAVDFLPLGYLLGILLIFANRRHQRLGDIAAGTLVIREGVLRPPPPRRKEFPSVLTPYRYLLRRIELSVEEYELISRFLERRRELDPARRKELRRRLFALLVRRHSIPPDGLDRESPDAQELFFEELIHGRSDSSR